MTPQEAGKLGSIVAYVTQQKQKQERIDKYLASPKLCKRCGNAIPYEKRVNVFCGHSCSAKTSNPSRRKKNNCCLYCGKRVERKFCSAVCHKTFQSEKRISENKTTKNDLIRVVGYACAECGITEWNGKPIMLDLEHKDGHSENNDIDNLCLLCPNCHSQTPTYKGRNFGNGRASRRQRYRDGKSY